MRELLEKIAAEGEVAADGVLKVDRFLNHQVDPQLMKRIGEAFAVRFRDERPTKVLTLESSGISPALMAAYELGIPLVVARKRRPLTMTGDVYRTEVYSFTKQEANEIIVSRSLLGRGDRVADH